VRFQRLDIRTETMTVILDRPKYSHNLAAAIRACACFEADQLFWTGKRFSFTDGERLPREERMKGYRSVRVSNTDRPFDHLPGDVEPVCIELIPSAQPLTTFVHPLDAAYVFGPEDGHVSQAFRGLCHHFVYIPAHHCLNLAAAINVVLADRIMKRQMAGDVPMVNLAALTERRGSDEIESVVGWDGK
jgi:tRNA(Leu) C34 or U34 (ribose-2'-O)-methylase TrmL